MMKQFFFVSDPIQKHVSKRASHWASSMKLPKLAINTTEYALQPGQVGDKKIKLRQYNSESILVVGNAIHHGDRFSLNKQVELYLAEQNLWQTFGDYPFVKGD